MKWSLIVIGIIITIILLIVLIIFLTRPPIIKKFINTIPHRTKPFTDKVFETCPTCKKYSGFEYSPWYGKDAHIPILASECTKFCEKYSEPGSTCRPRYANALDTTNWFDLEMEHEVDNVNCNDKTDCNLNTLVGNCNACFCMSW